MNTELPSVAIVGRPNVGKSSFFNAILKRRVAIVHSESGVTRDRIVATAFWEGTHFQIIDTGGLAFFKEEKKGLDFWNSGILKQVEAAISSAEIILFMTDINDGISPLDKDISEYLRASGKKVFLIANKSDNEMMDSQIANFAELGWMEIFPVSCAHRRGIDDVLDKVVASFKGKFEAPPPPILNITVAGRPNVGKSSIINRLLRNERVIVSDTPGTTRDSVDVSFEIKTKNEIIPALLVDTAGMREKRKADSAVEIFSIIRAENSIRRSDIVLFVIEAGLNGATAQDKKIASIISENGKGCLILANKLDLCGKTSPKEIIAEIRYTLPFMEYASILPVSALNGFNFSKITEEVARIRESIDISVATSVLNRIVGSALERNAPPLVKTRTPFKIYYATMTGKRPPEILLFSNYPELLPENYLSYLKNHIRRSLGITGCPIRIKLRKRTEPPSRQKYSHRSRRK